LCISISYTSSLHTHRSEVEFGKTFQRQHDIAGPALDSYKNKNKSCPSKFTQLYLNNAQAYIKKATSYRSLSANKLANKKAELYKNVLYRSVKQVAKEHIYPVERSVYGKEGNPKLAQIAKDLIYSAEDNIVLDPNNLQLLIAKVVCKARFPFIPSYSFIKTMIVNENTNSDVTGDDLASIAILNMIGDFIADNLLNKDLI